MSRLVIVVGSPILAFDPMLSHWAHLFLHDAFCREDPDTIIVTRNASPAELWAWEQAHACGLDRVIIGMDGMCWSSRDDPWRWPTGKEPPTLERATEVLLSLITLRMAGGFSAEVWSLEVEGYEMVDPLLPLARRLQIPICPYPVTPPPFLAALALAGE